MRVEIFMRVFARSFLPSSIFLPDFFFFVVVEPSLSLSLSSPFVFEGSSRDKFLVNLL